MPSRFAQQPFPEELSRLLLERGMSQRTLATQIGVSSSHLSRVSRRRDSKTPSMDLMRKVAWALGLDEGHFVEARIALIVERLESDKVFRDRTYRSLKR